MARLAIAISLLFGCAGAAAVRPPVAPVTVANEDRDEETRTLRARVRELETQLALSRAEARELRARASEARAEVVRIGDARPPAPAPEPPVEHAQQEVRGPRPVLRLYGAEPIPGPAAPIIVQAPPNAATRLDVVRAPGAAPEEGVPAIPGTPIPIVAPAPAPVAVVAAPAPDTSAVRYREALSAMSERRFDDALAGFDAFLRGAPDHAYADNALYWRGEIYFAQRDYARAIGELERLVARYPQGNKVPDAMLRIGLCYERLGDRERARTILDRLRARYPSSVAARLAAREDA